MIEWERYIDQTLGPLIKQRCALLDAPYYDNMGDVLIWEAMERFIARHGLTCVYRCSCETFQYRQLDEDVTIFLVGGGNFGDLWRGLQEFRNKIVQLYPHNRIVIFPQSVCYQDAQLLQHDADIFVSHPDVHICTRDELSYQILSERFTHNHILLLPDMALYLSFVVSSATTGKTLLLKREDKEAVEFNEVTNEITDTLDWPTMHISAGERQSFAQSQKNSHRLLRHMCQYLPSFLRISIYHLITHSLRCLLCNVDTPIRTKWKDCYLEYQYLFYINQKCKGRLSEIIDEWMNVYFRPLSVRYAESFIANYDTVYSTRLHGGILAMLMGKQTFLIDNSYGKISGVYNKWMQQIPNVSLI